MLATRISSMTFLLIQLGLALSANSIRAGYGTWTSGDPNMGPICSLALDPSKLYTLYAGGYNGVFKTINGGVTWDSITNGLVDSIGRVPTIYALAIDPLTPSIVYAAGDSGVYKTTDGGETWNSSSLNGWIRALAIDPISLSILYAGTYWSGIYKSTDNGGTWIAINSGINDDGIFALAIDPSAPSTLYAGTHFGVFKTTNAGESWNLSGSFQDVVFAFAIDPFDPKIVYAGVEDSDQAYKTNDGGLTWEAINSGLGNGNPVTCFAINPFAHLSVYAGIAYGGVYRSFNGGANWDSTGLSDRFTVVALAVDRQRFTTLYAATQFGVWSIMFKPSKHVRPLMQPQHPRK